MLQKSHQKSPLFGFFICMTHKKTSLRRVTGLPEQCSGGTIRLYEKPRLEERPLAPIYLRPVTFALRAPEGVLRRRHYTLLLHGVYYIAKRSFCTHGNGVLRPGNFNSVASLPLLQSQSQSFKHPSRRVSNRALISSHWVEVPNTRNKGASLMFDSWLRFFRRNINILI